MKKQHEEGIVPAGTLPYEMLTLLNKHYENMEKKLKEPEKFIMSSEDFDEKKRRQEEERKHLNKHVSLDYNLHRSNNKKPPRQGKRDNSEE